MGEAAARLRADLAVAREVREYQRRPGTLGTAWVELAAGEGCCWCGHTGPDVAEDPGVGLTCVDEDACAERYAFRAAPPDTSWLDCLLPGVEAAEAALSYVLAELERQLPIVTRAYLELSAQDVPLPELGRRLRPGGMMSHTLVNPENRAHLFGPNRHKFGVLGDHREHTEGGRVARLDRWANGGQAGEEPREVPIPPEVGAARRRAARGLSSASP